MIKATKNKKSKIVIYATKKDEAALLNIPYYKTESKIFKYPLNRKRIE